MISFFIYCLKVCICSFCFAGCYWLLLRQGRFYRWNRYYILAATLLSCCIPLLSIPVKFSTAEGISSFNTLLQYNLEAITVYVQSTANKIGQLLNLVNLLSVLYFVIVFSLAIVLMRSLLRIKQLQRGYHKVRVGAANIYMVSDKQAPYSFFSSVFWNENLPLDSADGQCVLRHELVHLRQRHSIDKIFMQLCCIVFWINPFFWLFRYELNLVHEFLADKESVADNDSGRLSAMILCSVYPQHYMQFISPFFQTPIKRRLIMLANKTSIKFKMQRKSVAILLPLLFLTFAVCNIHFEAIAQNNAPKAVEQPKAQPPQPSPPTTTEQQVQPKAVKAAKKTNTVPVAVVEVKPLFQDGDENLFARWVSQHMIYPQEAKDKGIEGKVLCAFTVNEEGKVVNVEVLRGADPLLDEASIAVISSSPAWTPGKHKGKKVAVAYTFPIIFSLKK